VGAVLSFRDFSQKFNGKTYLIALDGDFQMVYYRTDVLAKLGKAAAEDLAGLSRHRPRAAQGQDLSGDGKPDYGSCISKKRNAQAYWAILSIAGGYIQSQGTKTGDLLRHKKNMQPLTNNEAFAAGAQCLSGEHENTPPPRRDQSRRRRYP